MLKPLPFNPSWTLAGPVQAAEKPGKRILYKGLDYLVAAVKDHPGRPEAHYFLCYTINRINANDGADMNRITKAQPLLASVQFVLVTQLEKSKPGKCWRWIIIPRWGLSKLSRL